MNNNQLQSCFARLRRGDAEAFAAIYEDMKTPVYTVIYRAVGSHEAAEDIMQELFLRLFRTPPDIGVSNLRAYIFRAASISRRRSRPSSVLSGQGAASSSGAETPRRR